MSATDTTQAKPELAFVVYLKDEGRKYGFGPHLSFDMRAVHVHADGKIRNPDSWDRDEYADFKVTAQMDSDATDFYGREVEFEPFRVRLREAERMSKVLRRVHKGLERLTERFGAPSDMAAFLGQVAWVTKAKKNPFLVKVSGPDSGGYDDQDYGHFDVDTLRYRLASEVKAWREKHGIVREEATA